MINVSSDKIVIEYREVPAGWFIGWYGRQLFQSTYKLRRMEFKKLFVYQLHASNDDGSYLQVFYQNFRETSGGLYTLRIETRPEYLVCFSEWLEEFRQVAAQIVFVGCDVAYDVASPLSDVFVVSNDMRRECKVYEGTRYFGTPQQRKQNGYCRVYDKKLELYQRHGIEIEGELTRVEMVYKPEGRILLADVPDYPPQQNRNYFAAGIEDWSIFSEKQVQRIRHWQVGAETYTPYVRKSIKKSLADRTLNLDRLVSERWPMMMDTPIAVILGRSVA